MSDNSRNNMGSSVRERRGILGLSVAVSLLLHLLLLRHHISISLDHLLAEAGPKTQQIRVVLKDPPLPKVVTKPAAESKQLMRQVVNNELTGDKVLPKNSRFLGEKNQSYARQTKAKRVASFKRAGIGSESSNSLDQGKNRVTNKQKKISLKDLAVSSSRKVVMAPSPKRQKVAGLKYGDRNSLGHASNNDFLEDVPLGDMTNLNTVEFKYYGFYHRIRQKLEQYWGDSLREKSEYLFRSGRRLPSNENKITALTVTIDAKGNIINVNVKSTSGIRELDDAAVESFNRAGPFPNPPAGMIKGGQARLEWGFVVNG
ncbi:MAG: energy transducer TonB [Bdellovibrionales bacterium]|jgi:TonB family protein|nr:energy transducer TonB [Bdellovibrionales bacterium]MBT3525572.1 energy transducer TonB [Bdellovibrionales bacterium]MBT7669598.1 energy transducer TonB [Bdellovibrionales bacterium]MBT7767351.1 energy transducer TonB [Bdellovibrionales bacterium]